MHGARARTIGYTLRVSSTTPPPSSQPRPSLVRSFVARNPWVIPAISRVHGFLYQLFGGRFVARSGNAEMLLLTSIGRRSGKPRATPLLYVRDGSSFVVVASNGGTERVPAWWLNLQATPEARVQCGPDSHAVIARAATPEDTERLWPKLSAAYEFFDEYQSRTQRAIPVVILERVS